LLAGVQPFTRSAASSQRVSYPSEDSPQPQPHRVSTTVASVVFASLADPVDSAPPLPASSSVSNPRDASPSRRCSAVESVPVTAVSSGLPAYPPWALVLFEVLRPAGSLPWRMRRARRAPASRCASSLLASRRSRRMSRGSFAPFRPRFFVARGPAVRLGIPPPAMGARGSSRRSFLRRSSRPRRSGFDPHRCGMKGIAGRTFRRTVDARVLGRGRLSTPVARIPRGSARHALRRTCEVAFRPPPFGGDLRASFHRHHGLGDPREPEDGTVGLDPSRACVRTSLFTMNDHGWPPLPMTRP
jgi:hypothetical protein